MATNKNATIRYHALDRCFSNYGRKFYIEDLIDACNQALYDFSGIKDGVKRRQVFNDITFMESEHGWSIPLERVKDGKRVYYRYTDKSFSIRGQGINQSEAEQIQETLSILSRFKGLPQFDWIEEIQVRLEDTFHLKGNPSVSVGFEQNPYLKGLDYFSDLFNAIQNQEALKIEYKGFKEATAKTITFHPWYLKQYNNRWFAFGYNSQFSGLSNLAVDRIISIQKSGEPYVNNDQYNFEEFFEDVVGVTVDTKAAPEKLLLKISSDLWPYIESKPIHGSQKVKASDENEVVIELEVQINHELISLLFSFMDGIEIVSPKELRSKFRNKLENSLRKYL